MAPAMAFPPRRDLPSAVPTLTGPTIHVWAARLDPPAWRVAELRRLLDPDEQQRADRFRFEIHRRRFIVGRGFQRIVLGAYAGIEPARIVYSHGPKGKPAFATMPEVPLYFNLSNSEELAILGLNREIEIGVDVEYLRDLDDAAALAERFFSRGESEVLLALPPEQLREGFFNCWTRKEAYLKAVGDGLTAPLNAFDVTLRPGEEPEMLLLEGSAERAKRWSLHHLWPAEGYLGAIAIEGRGFTVDSWFWADSAIGW